MKKFFALAVLAIAFAADSFAQGYDRVYVSYAPTKEHVSESGVSISSPTMQGVEAGYFHGFGLTSSTPLYLEVGANVQYAAKDGADICNIKIPVNLTYKAPIGSNLAIAPYAGINAKFNVVAEGKDDNGKKQSLFDDNQDGKANRFQMGWQAGVNFYITDFYVGVGYQGDITKFVSTPSIRFNGLVATVGYSF